MALVSTLACAWRKFSETDWPQCLGSPAWESLVEHRVQQVLSRCLVWLLPSLEMTGFRDQECSSPAPRPAQARRQQDPGSGSTSPHDQGAQRTHPWVHSQTHVGENQRAACRLQATGARGQLRSAADPPTVQISTQGSRRSELPRCVLGKVRRWVRRGGGRSHCVGTGCQAERGAGLKPRHPVSGPREEKPFINLHKGPKRH